MAKLFRVDRELHLSMTYASRSAVHSISAFLHLSSEARQADSVVAKTLVECDPRDLLRRAIPDAPRRLYRALDRAGNHARSAAFYRRLGEISVGPLADWLLSWGPLNDARLHHCGELMQMDPSILPLLNLLVGPYELDAVNTVVPYLRAYGVFADRDLDIPRGGGVKAVMKRLQRALDRIVAPPAPFNISPPPFRIIQTVRELREVGTKLGNCVRTAKGHGPKHWFRLADGSSVYLTSDAPLMLAALRQIAPGLWLLDELQGAENTSMIGSASTALTDALHAAGVRLVDQEPARALLRLGF